MTPPTRWRSVFLLALLAVVVVAASRAAVSVIWRNSVLSFDNPATQILDELASQKAPHADPLLEAGTALRTAASISRPFSSYPQVGHQRSRGRCCIEARAPPVV